MALVYSAVKTRQIRVPIVDSLDTTGLVLADFTITASISGEYSADPETDLSLSLDEVDSVNLPGYYELVITPSEVGTTYLKLVDNDTHELHLQVEHEGLDLVGEALRGAEGTLEINVVDAVAAPSRASLSGS